MTATCWLDSMEHHRWGLKQRVHAMRLTHGKPCPSPICSVSVAPPAARPARAAGAWQGTIEASLRLIDELDREITDCERELRRLGTDHRDVPLLCTVPGISWLLAYPIAAEIGDDIERFASPRKLGPRYLRWPLVEAATHACTHPVSQIDLARRLSQAIWHMLRRGEPFAPKGATDPLAA